MTVAIMTWSKKKKETVNSNKTHRTAGTVTEQHFTFIASTLDVMDCHEEFKDHYLAINNVPIHTMDNVRKFIENRGYKCIYLLPYSPELNPIK